MSVRNIIVMMTRRKSVEDECKSVILKRKHKIVTVLKENEGRAKGATEKAGCNNTKWSVSTRIRPVAHKLAMSFDDEQLVWSEFTQSALGLSQRIVKTAVRRDDLPMS